MWGNMGSRSSLFTEHDKGFAESDSGALTSETRPHSGMEIMTSRNDLEHRILSFLKGRHLANLATVEGQRPNVSAVEFVNDGLTLFFVSIPKTQKVINLAANPAVALAVNSTERSRDEVMGVQY